MDFDDEKSFGDLLARYRTETRKSQQYLADCLHVSRSTIVKWEQKGILPKDRTRIEEIVLCLNLRDAQREALFKAALLPLPLVIQNLPYHRNPFFTGRNQELERLHVQLQQKQTAAIGQMQSISGLGGIGKTQLAVEYAYRHHDTYQYVLWARAENMEALNSSFTEIAHLLSLPEKDEQEQAITIQAVKRWLQRQHGWLLILDNADSPALLSDYLPPTVGGHLLITTRAAEVSTYLAGLAHPLVVDSFSNEQSVLFLLHRSGLLALDATLDRVEAPIRQFALSIAHELGGLPLALDQAGAYLKATGCSLAVYQQIYQKHRTYLLKERRSADHPEPVATTWALSFQKVKQLNPAAADLLEICAFLAPDAIPEEFLIQGAAYLSHALEAVMIDPFLLNQTIEILRGYSLLNRDPQTRMLSIHRLVQATLCDEMKKTTIQQWIERIIRMVLVSLPGIEPTYWPSWERLFGQVQACIEQIKQSNLQGTEVISLLDQTGRYLMQRLRYREAEPLLERVLLIQEQQWGTDHLLISTHLNNLADLYQVQSKYKQAELLYQRTLVIQEKQLGTESLQITSILDKLALFSEKQGKYSQAENLYMRAFTIREKHLGTDHPDTILSLHKRANLLAFLSEDVLAEYLDRLVLAACNRLKSQISKSQISLEPTHLDTLAHIYSGYSEHKQAEDLHQYALIIREKKLGAEHLDTSNNLINLAKSCNEQKKYEQAESLYHRALAIYERQFGIEDCRVVPHIVQLALFYEGQKKYEQVESLYQRALAIYERQFGIEDPLTAKLLFNLASIYDQQERYEQAELLYQHALSIYEPIITDYFVARCLVGLADVYSKQKKYEQARALYQRALTIYMQEPGATYSERRYIYKNLATLLQTMGYSEEAEKLEEKARQDIPE